MHDDLSSQSVGIVERLSAFRICKFRMKTWHRVRFSNQGRHDWWNCNESLTRFLHLSYCLYSSVQYNPKLCKLKANNPFNLSHNAHDLRYAVLSHWVSWHCFQVPYSCQLWVMMKLPVLWFSLYIDKPQNRCLQLALFTDAKEWMLTFSL